MAEGTPGGTTENEIKRWELEGMLAAMLVRHTPNGKAYFIRETLVAAPTLEAYTTDVQPGDGRVSIAVQAKR